jgi:hypothetical protein
MLAAMHRVAFSLPDVGLRELRGLAYIEDEFLVLRIEDTLAGLMDKKVSTIKILPAALKSVDIHRGLTKDRLVLRPNRSELLDAIPGEHPVALELRVKKKYSRDLDDLLAAYHRLSRNSSTI